MSSAGVQATDTRSLRRIAVVAASIYLTMAANGSMLLLVVGLKQVAADLDWPRSVPSLANALLYIGSGFGGIVMGYWFDRSGVAPVTFVGTTMMGLAAILTSQVHTAWQLYLIYGLMMGLLGNAAIYGPLVLNVMSWFRKRRGFAVGLIAAGQGIGGTLWPMVFRHFNETAGWRETFFWFGVFVLLTAVPLTLTLKYKRATRVKPASDAQKTASDDSEEPEPVKLQPWLVQTVLCMAIVGCCVAMAMPLAHLFAHTSDLGHPTARAAEMLAVSLLIATVARMLVGSLVIDRLGGLRSLLIFSGCQAAAIALYAGVESLPMLYVVSVLFGIGYGGTMLSYPLLVRDYLPRNQSGRRLGIVLLFGALGMALGGWLAGVIFDYSGAYAPAFLVGAGFNVFNLLLVLALLIRVRNARLQTVTG